MDELIFLYNVNSDLISKMEGYIQKVLSPNRHPCNLTIIIQTPFGERKNWVSFLSKLPYKKTFLCKDKLIPNYTMLKNSSSPAIFLRTKTEIKILVTTFEINKLKTAKELITLLDKKLKSL